MPSTIPTEEHGGSINPRLTMRREEFRQLNRIQKKIGKLQKTIEFNDEQLQDISVVRGAPFDIDEDDPIDLDPRFFLPGPVDDMEHGLEAMSKTEGLGRYRWPQAEPIKLHRLRDGDEREYEIVSENAYWDARSRGMVWPSAEDGRPCWNNWNSGEYFMWSRGPRKSGYHPNVPHAMATIYDSSSPRHEGLLHSELLVATCLLKAQIRPLYHYLDHHVYPVLVVSFHGRFSARIVQAYFENGRIVVRPSRLINLHTRVVSPEVRLLARWLNSRPVGNTRLPVSEYKPVDDNSSLPVEVTDMKGVLSPTISVQ
ncbi:hypothetical protein AK830_g763 [Neonectria ditissima]|uniref:Uncharacterized protein n=1 Tax=Neonectria ditissima TaxID=78410 RepID=A0A0P7BW24_9HYPO|nr:hypothetical protein AK830_g763 [Neonectria ditissima]